MTFRFAVIIHNSIFLICVLGTLSAELASQDFRTVRDGDGIEYSRVDRRLGEDPVKINLLRLDLRKVRLDVHHAMDAAIGTEKTSSIAIRHGAIAAINAGFFRLDNSIFAGDAAGTLMIDGTLLSESSNSRSALLINNRGESTQVAMANLDIWTNLKAGSYSFSVGGINRERKDDELVLFTPQFGRSTLTSSGTEYIVRRGRIVGIVSNRSSNPIPPDGYILSAGEKWADDPFKILRVNRRVALVHKRGLLNTAGNFVAEDITNGVSLLVSGGKIHLTWEKERASRSFAETRHPRTAVAELKDGKFLMLTVDGRQPGLSVGMTLYELAEYLLSLGALNAMNLDGGGSTTMFLYGKVVNTPSDREGERKVGDAILVTLR